MLTATPVLAATEVSSKEPHDAQPIPKIAARLPPNDSAAEFPSKALRRTLIQYQNMTICNENKTIAIEVKIKEMGLKVVNGERMKEK